MVRTLVPACALLLATTTFARADERAPRAFHIDAQSLAAALSEFARQSGQEILFKPDLTAQKSSHGVHGTYPPLDALKTILQDTGLTFSTTPSGAILVVAAVKDRAAGVEPGPAELQEVVVEAGKLGSTVAKTPQSITVLSSVDFELRGVRDLTDAMRYVPGAVTEIYGFEGRGYEWILLRGFDATYTGNFRDGLNQAWGWYAIPYTEPYNVERIEILRGPSSALFGQSDAGGIVNRITKRPDASAPSEFVAELGTFDRKKVGADVGGVLDADATLRYRLVGTVLDSGTQRKYPNGDSPVNTSFFAAPSLLWNISPHTSITLLTDFRKSRWRGYSYSVTSPDDGYDGLLVGDRDFTRNDHRQGSFGYRFEHRCNDFWELRQNFRFSHMDAQVDDIYADGFDADGHTLKRHTIKNDDWIDQMHADTQLQGELGSAAVHQTLLLGVDVSRSHWDLLFHDGAAPSLDILNPSYSQRVDEANVVSLDLSTQTELNGIYAQYRAQFDQGWSVILGSRYDWATVTTDDAVAALVTRQEDQAFTARVGLSYQMANDLVPYLSYSESFLPQGGADANGTPFDPTHGTQYEAGVKYQPSGVKGIVTIAVFDITKTNVVTADPDNYGYSYTKGELQSRGIELEGRLAALDGLDVAVSYTYLEVEATKSNNGDAGRMPIQIPGRTMNLWVDYERFPGVLHGLTLSGGVRYTGRRFDDVLNTRSSAAYTLFDAGVRYSRGSWRYALNAVNAFDKRYIQSRASGGYALGYERTLSATVKYLW